LNANSPSLRGKIAREAASLLYSGAEKEYKQAKLKAARTFQCKFLPTNLEIAVELDKIAEENEGPARKKRLIHLRKEALKLMSMLKEYNPILIGSVWRGTAHHESDIDITVHHDETSDILRILERNDLKIAQTKWMSVTKKGQKKTSFHIYLETPSNENIEIIVRNLEQLSREEKCEVYGDKIIGLTLKELGKLLKENPQRRFLPFEDT
jgi:predicted nucleotidyltransferase